MTFSKLLVVAAIATTGCCSLVSLRPPPTTGPSLKARRAQACGGKYPTWLYPLADASWALAGGLMILDANKSLDEDPPNKGWYRTFRGFGIASLVIGTPSMLYGLWVAGECSNDPAEGEPTAHGEGAVAQPGITRPKFDFPTGLNGFAFGTDLKTAENKCNAQGDTFEATETSARCVPEDPLSRPTIALDYELGALNSIALMYRAPKGLLNDHLDSLERNLQSQYGTPYRHRSLSSRCIQSLGYCLQQGETPRGAAWHLPNGTIDMMPTLEQEDPVIVIRYSREAPVGP